MTDALILRAQEIALDKLNRFGVQGTIVWSGAGSSLTQTIAEVSESVTFVSGEQTTTFVNNRPVSYIDALMSHVGRNPIGATITVGGNVYKVVSSNDLGQAPDDIAAHKLVVTWA